MADSVKGRTTATRCGIAGMLFIALSSVANAQRMTAPKISIKHITTDFGVTELDHRSWRGAGEIEISKYWNGKEAPAGRGFKVRMLWSAKALYARFEAAQSEPLVVNDKPDVTKKTMHLWDRDVCEIFLAPDRTEPRKYLEFEVAPTGEWIDLAIDLTGEKRKTDWDFKSGMESAAKVEGDRVVMTMKLPWSAWKRAPKAGEVWVGNLFRCVGKDPDRGYLAWSPTMTAEPAYHVPEKFGEFEFVK